MSVARSDADAVRRAIQTQYCCGIQSEGEGKNRERLEAYFSEEIDTSHLHGPMEDVAEQNFAAAGRRLKIGKVEAVPEEVWVDEWR